MPLLKEETYTIDDIYALPEGERAELIDGHMYMMAPPSRRHQRISTKLVSIIDRYIEEHKGKCHVYAAPFAVYLDERSNTYVEPDISVICDPNKLDDRGCKGHLTGSLRLYHLQVNRWIIIQSYLSIEQQAFVNIGLLTHQRICL